jgi:hypothetical protein
VLGEDEMTAPLAQYHSQETDAYQPQDEERTHQIVRQRDVFEAEADAPLIDVVATVAAAAEADTVHSSKHEDAAPILGHELGQGAEAGSEPDLAPGEEGTCLAEADSVEAGGRDEAEEGTIRDAAASGSDVQVATDEGAAVKVGIDGVVKNADPDKVIVRLDLEVAHTD